jgi:hypothetical protein
MIECGRLLVVEYVENGYIKGKAMEIAMRTVKRDGTWELMNNRYYDENYWDMYLVIALWSTVSL